MAKKSAAKTAEVGSVCHTDRASQRDGPTSKLKPSSLLDSRVIYCGDNLEQLAKLPGPCVDLIYIAPPLNFNGNHEIFNGEP